MLRLDIPAREIYIEETNEFVEFEGKTIQLEHSLVSISKWEAKWHKAFLNPKTKKTLEETIDYIKCMTLTQNVDDKVFLYLTDENIKTVNAYIENPMTATWFNEDKKNESGSKKGTGETITSELIYYWMISLQIPVEFQKWHLNRLLTLIKVCNIKNTPPEKLNKRELMNRNRSLNEARKKALHTKG